MLEAIFALYLLTESILGIPEDVENITLTPLTVAEHTVDLNASTVLSAPGGPIR